MGKDVCGMAKVAILLPYLEMCEIARPLVGDYRNLNVMCVEYSKSDRIAQRVRELERQGCELIIARGLHARIIKATVEIPLVEMRVTTQELGGIILELKRELGLERPSIGLIHFDNMVGDTARLNELLGIDLRRFPVKQNRELLPSVEQAVREGCRAVIGGDLVCGRAQALGLPSRFLPSGKESMIDALDTAARMCYAIDLEKSNSRQMNVMLDNIFSGIAQVDSGGVIRRVNRAGYNILGLRPDQVLGLPAAEVLPGLSGQVLEDTLREGKEAYSLVMDIQRRAVMVNVAPIPAEDGQDGAILTFQEGQRIIEMDSELRRELYLRGYIAKFTFERIYDRNPDIAPAVALAKRVAKYPAPILLTGETGCGKNMMAQCIHNESMAKGNAFVPLDCSAWLPETLDNMLFGNYTTKKDSPACMAELAQDGTLYLNHVEALPMETQYKLLSLVQGRFLHNGSNRPTTANVRVIAATDANLIAKIEQGAFRSDLYYAVSALTVELPPLRRCPEDVLNWVDFYLETWQDRYKRYVHLTNGAREFLKKYDWPGNLDQVNNVCERIVLLTEKRSIDEVFVRRQLERVTPRLVPGTEKTVVFKDQKGAEIAALLRKYGGNREKVAAELGVSKTTLWRYIKKYGIEPDFTY